MKYTFLKHTADAKFQASGKNLEEAFTNAALAMTSIMFDVKKIKNKIEKSIYVEGRDEKQLLYNWLEELLFLFDTEGFVLKGVIKLKIKGGVLQVEIVGDFSDGKYEMLGGIKAVTYSEMFIKKELGKVTVQVVVDI